MATRKTRKKRNGIEYRADRGKWGFRFCLQGVSYKRFAWDSRAEAQAARNEFKKELASRPKKPELPPAALITVVSDYLIDSAEKGRSQWRIDGMRWNLDKVIIPFFGAATPVAEITTAQIQKLVLQRKRTVKPKTIWHDITNLRACLNWACKPRELPDGRRVAPLLIKNPVDGLDKTLIGNTKSKKAPLNLAAVERAAGVLDPPERAYFDYLRFTGLRKDEANRLRWDDLNFEQGFFPLPRNKDRRIRRLPAVGAGIDRKPEKAQRDQQVRICLSRALCADEWQKDLLAPPAVRENRAVNLRV